MDLDVRVDGQYSKFDRIDPINLYSQRKLEIFHAGCAGRRVALTEPDSEYRIWNVECLLCHYKTIAHESSLIQALRQIMTRTADTVTITHVTLRYRESL